MDSDEQDLVDQLAALATVRGVVHTLLATRDPPLAPSVIANALLDQTLELVQGCDPVLTPGRRLLLAEHARAVYVQLARGLPIEDRVLLDMETAGSLA